MFALKRRKDSFRLLIPKEFIPDELTEKYSKILRTAKSFYTRPIDFLNESIQKIDVLGFNGGTMSQPQVGKGTPMRNPNRVQQNSMNYMASDVIYRPPTSPIQLLDKTINIEFRHTLGYLNYFLLMESFIYQYSRDTKGLPDLDFNFTIELLNENGATYSRIVLFHPLIDSLDMLSFDTTSPIAQTESFKCVFKYTNFDYEFIETDNITDNINLDDYIKEVTESKPFFDGPPIIENDNRIPNYGSNSPFDTLPGSVLMDGQIIYGDESGILKDIIQPGLNKPWASDSTDDPNNPNDPDNPDVPDNPNNPDISETRESFISAMTTDRSKNANGLTENEKFARYPYPEHLAREKSTLDISKSPDNSKEMVDENGMENETSKTELFGWDETKLTNFGK